MFYIFKLILITNFITADCNDFFDSQNKILRTMFQWKYIDFDWPSHAIKQQYIQNGIYDYTAIVPIDVDYSDLGKL